MRTALTLVTTLLLVAGTTARVEAEVLAPGRYTGWIVQDRWGDVFLANGSFRLKFHGKSKAQALEHNDKPVTVDASKMKNENDRTRGIAEVKSIEAAKPLYEGTLRIELQQPEIDPPPKDRQELDVIVRYEGRERLKLDLKRLVVFVRRIGKPLPKDNSVKGTVFDGKDASGTPWRVGGRFMEVIETDKRVLHFQEFKALGGKIEATGSFQYSATLVMNLPEGAYEFVAVLGGRNFSQEPAPLSNGLSYDILPK